MARLFVLSFFMAVYISTPQQGAAQSFVSLVRNDAPSLSTICGNQNVELECTVGGPRLQWIAEPFINSTGSSAVTFGNNAGDINRTLPMNSQTGVVAQQISVDPLVSVLRINQSVLSSPLSVTCSSRDGRSMTEEYFLASEFQSPPDFKCEHLACNFFMCDFTLLDGLDIQYYSLYCVDGSCENITNITIPQVITITNGVGIILHQVRLFAVNRCGVKGSVSEFSITIPGITIPDCIAPLPCRFALWWISVIVIVVLLVIIIAVLIVGLVICCALKKIKDKGDGGIVTSHQPIQTDGGEKTSDF